LHDWRRQLDQLFLLTRDDLLARLLKDLGRVQAERVERDGRIPQRAGERRGIALQALGASWMRPARDAPLAVWLLSHSARTSF
jgi:hypothetical protein